MRFTALATVLGLAAIVTAQSSTATTAATTASVSLTPQQVCLSGCGRADVCCQARCVNVPCPSDLQANATTECAAKCPQGNGSQSETDRYAQCQQSCISSLFFPLSATAAPAGSGGTAAATTTAHSGSASGSHSGGASGASATSSPSPTTNAAAEVRFGPTGAGLIGLLFAGLLL